MFSDERPYIVSFTCFMCLLTYIEPLRRGSRISDLRSILVVGYGNDIYVEKKFYIFMGIYRNGQGLLENDYLSQ